MDTEYEIKFIDIKRENIRKKLKEIGAKLVRPEYLQKRITLNPPKGNRGERTWLRVRDEGNRITMALKSVTTEENIDGQKELELVISDFGTAEKLLSSIGCEKKAYQETKRELWVIDNVEVTIDEWPFLDPFIEIEGKSESEVRKIVEKLGFDYSNGIFGSVAVVYRDKYGISIDRISNHTPRIVFGEKNPFL